jgi:hypothetical protein
MYYALFIFEPNEIATENSTSCETPDLSGEHATNTSIKRQKIRCAYRSSLSHLIVHKKNIFPVKIQKAKKTNDFPLLHLLLLAQARKAQQEEEA